MADRWPGPNAGCRVGGLWVPPEMALPTLTILLPAASHCRLSACQSAPAPCFALQLRSAWPDPRNGYYGDQASGRSWDVAEPIKISVLSVPLQAPSPPEFASPPVHGGPGSQDQGPSLARCPGRYSGFESLKQGQVQMQLVDPSAIASHRSVESTYSKTMIPGHSELTTMVPRP